MQKKREFISKSTLPSKRNMSSIKDDSITVTPNFHPTIMITSLKIGELNWRLTSTSWGHNLLNIMKRSSPVLLRKKISWGDNEVF
jgi:hypothetical protein